jgi:hypothetical protein
MVRADAAKAPKTASQFFIPEFTPERCARLMTICGVMHKGDLPEIWRLLPQHEKKDRLAVELALKQTAQRVGLTQSTPVVTPEFAKRLLSLNFTGNDQDNIAEGVQPLALIIMHHQNQTSHEAMRLGHDEAANYDIMNKGEVNNSLSDAMILRGCTWAHVSFDIIHGEAMLEATLLVLHVMFGSDHPLVISASSFMACYNSDRLAIQHSLASHGAIHYEARFVRYFGLRLTNWFRRMDSSTIPIGAPDFEQIVDQLEVDDPTWFPSLPAAYPTLPSRVGASQAAASREAATPPTVLVAPAPAAALAATSAPAPAPT